MSEMERIVEESNGNGEQEEGINKNVEPSTTDKKKGKKVKY